MSKPRRPKRVPICPKCDVELVTEQHYQIQEQTKRLLRLIEVLEKQVGIVQPLKKVEVQ